ncbi:carbonic anhydrase family protein [Undibacterium sp.]|uniref:carbonic anhydrase n=1 Tax=Undibacterium sp. TaxID=1914977 RepID=UPI002C0D6DA2|nr:carbonic anhydrase family protein [Undibacterium sp.]HTD04117.1 carbonic anhydrase family protein [Undibacterium sp.]
MRSLLALLLSALLASAASAADPSTTPSTPIKQAASKEAVASAVSSAAKDDAKPAVKEGKLAKSAAAARAREAQEADELAAKIAEKLAVIRKEKEEAGAVNAASARSIAKPAYKSPYAMPVRRADAAEFAKTKAAADVVGTTMHWSYEGEDGPLRWGKLNPTYAKCDIGERQSPIDIRDGLRVDLNPVTFDYKPSRFNVIDNGHTIQVNVGPGNYISLLGHNYEMVQFHFHKPSEERINGRGFEMVVHLVHKDGEGKLAVVAVLLERGKAQSLIQTVWNNLPLERNDPVQPLITMDVSQLLPQQREYYTYMGSLTTPPCTEGVLWIVMKQPVEVSPEQLAIFGRLYPMNARPVQKTSARVIKESN